MSTRVVNVRHEECDVYIGRRTRSHRFAQNEYPWGNPYKVGRDGDIDFVLALYEEHVRSRPDLMARLPELKGKRLGCWCSPDAGGKEQPCHGHVLVKLVEEEASK